MLLLVGMLAIACGPANQPDAPRPARYLYAWAYDVDAGKEDTNFLAIIDADSTSPSYATVVATLPAGMVGGMPHHTEQHMPPNGWPLFANAFHAGRSFLLDLADPGAPKLAGEADPVPGYHMPHSFYRLSDGNVVATLQFGPDSVAGKPGGLALFTPAGKLIRVTSSRDSAFPGAPIRTYSGDISETADRVITVSSPMDTERTAHVIQLYRLSDLQLLRTVAVPQQPSDTMGWYPFEVRFLNEGREAFLNTYYCAFFHVTGVADSTPRIQRVFQLEFPENSGCGVPLLIGRWWIMPVETSRRILVLDLSDPSRPRQHQVLATDSSFAPHWSSRDPGSDRLVFPTVSESDARILVARFDTATGQLSWDESFKDPATGRLGVSLNRASWPHGATGPAAPHGVVFSRERR